MFCDDAMRGPPLFSIVAMPAYSASRLPPCPCPRMFVTVCLTAFITGPKWNLIVVKCFSLFYSVLTKNPMQTTHYYFHILMRWNESV